MVVLTNWAVELWACGIREVFDTWRLWWFPPKKRDAVDYFDLKRVLGTDGERDALRAV